MDIENFTTAQPAHAGTYILRVSVPETASYVGSVRYEFTISKARITKPAAPATVLTYNGNEQTVSIAANAAYTIEGNKGTNASIYTATVALKDKANHEWADGSDGNLKLAWTIAKATPTPAIPIGLTAKEGQKLGSITLSKRYRKLQHFEKC
ncbi:hypothetical protein R83H12_00151 [Fibrobacteria bacterium R8-3-H12]